MTTKKTVTESDGFDAWTAHLPLYDGPQAVRALKIFFVEKYGERVEGTITRGKPISPPAPPWTPSGDPPVVERKADEAPAAKDAGRSVFTAVDPPVLPDRGAGQAVALITPKDSRYRPFEVDASYLARQPLIGGYYLVYENGSEGFLSALDFEKVYTLHVD